jgi:CHAT domain-containing protein
MRVPRAALAATILVLPFPARASDLDVCEKHLAQAPRGEAPALCLFEMATGMSPGRTAAAERLQALIKEYPESPWFPIYLARTKTQGQDPDEVRKARELYLLGADLAVKSGTAEAEFDARRGLCRLLRDEGRLEEEEAELERAVRVAESSGLPRLRLSADILRALHWSAMGELEQAFLTLRRIQAGVEREDSYLLLREYLFAIAKSARQTGRFREARQAYRSAAESAAAAGDLAWQAQAVYGLATVSMSEFEETPSEPGRRQLLELARSALELARSAKHPYLEMHSLWMLGSLGDAEDATGYLERCFAVAATVREQSFCRSALARRLADSDPGAAKAAIHEALALARQSGDVQARTSSWIQHMRVSWTLNPRQEAMEDAGATLDVIEALRDQQGGSTGQPGLFSTWAEQYYWLSGRLLEAWDLERAFGVIERMRSRTLIDSLGLSGRDSAASPALRQASFASLEQVGEALAGDEALLSFQIAPWRDLAGDFGGGAWLLVSTRRDTRVYRLPDRTELRQDVSAFIGMFEARNGSEARGASVLYEELLAPALAELPPDVRRLAIVPDDYLHRLPFAALRPEPDGDPLATRYEITLAPSATLWLHWRQFRPAPAVTPALVLADPVTLLTRGGAAGERSATVLTPVRLGPLPDARTEGKAVIRHLGGGQLLVGKDASETYVKRNAAGAFGLVHFAAHAVTDEVNPDRSAIYLSPGNSKEDGKLQVREIADLDLDGRIVVLSTCESASGGILRGEGVMGLARAFFQAGAHTVVASLWELRDDDGAALFDRFYRHIGKGKSVAAALQAAQRDRMDDGAPAEAWAGVVVLGDGDRVPVPGGRRPSLVPWALVLGLLAAALLVYTARRARKRRRTIA